MTSPIIIFSPIEQIESPCVNICSIDPHDGYCEGCRRTLDEIARWTTMPGDERDQIMGELADR